MVLAEQLRGAGVPCFPCWTRWNAARGRWDKGPAVGKNDDWRDVAAAPLDVLDWSSGVVGVPIPPGVYVIDMDAQKGVNSTTIDRALGCALPWAAAHIQNTINGGLHFAFRVPDGVDLRQGANLHGVDGFDTRAAGRGFICAGNGYQPVGAGVLALAAPWALPELPAAALEALRPVSVEHTDGGLPAAPTAGQKADAIAALAHIPPDCSRDWWRNVGYAIRAIFRDDPEAGRSVYEYWSSGGMHGGVAPENYVSEGRGSVADQWPTFRADGDVGPSSLFYYAMQGGWRPPAHMVDAAAAFAAPPEQFADLLAEVRASAGDVSQVPALIAAIQAARCSPLQTALLAAELKTELQASGVKDKAVSQHIDRLLQTRPPGDYTPEGEYGKNDTDNAALFLGKHYADDGLVRCDGLFLRFTGQAWALVTPDTLKGQVYRDMAAQRVQESKAGSCYRMVSNLCPTLDGQLNQTPDHLVIFRNGVYDLHTGQLGPHDRRLFTTNALPYDYNPRATCPQWLAFLYDAFDGDAQRVGLLQEWLGYLMSRSYAHQKIMFLWGGPRCGKGTVGRVLHALVGDENFAGGQLSSLASDSYINAICTKSAVFIGDAQKRIHANKVADVIERLKSISGNDAITWHRMYHGGVSATLPTRFTIGANNLPQLFDDSGALGSRLLLLTFDKSYLGREDLTLSDRLLAEIEGVAVWALEGLRRLQAVGRFTQPEAVIDEHRMIAEAYSPLLKFVADCCELDSSARTPVDEMYDAYRAWVVREQDELLRPKTFTQNLRDSLRGRGVRYGPHRFDDGTRGRGWEGLRVVSKGLSASAFRPEAAR